MQKTIKVSMATLLIGIAFLLSTNSLLTARTDNTSGWTETFSGGGQFCEDPGYSCMPPITAPPCQCPE